MSAKWNKIKDEYFYPSYPMCWICMIRTADDGGHGVINKGQVRNRKYHKLLDVKENFVPQCRECNMKAADSFENRQSMYVKKCKELGQERMDNWLANLPFVIRELF